jgi:hypothetical protein
MKTFLNLYLLTFMQPIFYVQTKLRNLLKKWPIYHFFKVSYSFSYCVLRKLPRICFKHSQLEVLF